MKKFDLQLFAEESPADTTDTGVGEGQEAAISGQGQADARSGWQQESEAVVFDFTETVKSKGMELDNEVADGFARLLTKAGVKDNAVANEMAGYGMQYALDGIQQMRTAKELAYLDETLKHYGCTLDAPSKNYTQEVAKVGAALEALEAKVPGLRQVFVENGLGNNLKVVQAFALIGENVGEDRNLMTGTSAQTKSAADIMFGDMFKK